MVTGDSHTHHGFENVIVALRLARVT
jgi:hypothetical protein